MSFQGRGSNSFFCVGLFWCVDCWNEYSNNIMVYNTFAISLPFGSVFFLLTHFEMKTDSHICITKSLWKYNWLTQNIWCVLFLFIYLFIFILFYFYFFWFYFIFKLYIIVLVLPNIKMNLPQVYMCSPSWTLLPPPSPFHIIVLVLPNMKMNL